MGYLNMLSYRQASADFLRAHPELQRFRKKRLCWVIVKMCLSFIAVAAIAVFLYLQTPHVVILVLGAVIALAAAYRVGMPHRHFARRYATVEKIEYLEKRVSRKGNIRGMTDAIVLVADVKHTNGSMKKLEWPTLYDGVLRSGDTLLQIPGIPFLLTPTPHDKVICPFCGGVMPRDNDYCVECKRINMYDRTPAEPIENENT